jgi:hypothetical protein
MLYKLTPSKVYRITIECAEGSAIIHNLGRNRRAACSMGFRSGFKERPWTERARAEKVSRLFRNVEKLTIKHQYEWSLISQLFPTHVLAPKGQKLGKGKENNSSLRYEFKW